MNFNALILFILIGNINTYADNNVNQKNSNRSYSFELKNTFSTKNEGFKVECENMRQWNFAPNKKTEFINVPPSNACIIKQAFNDFSSAEAAKNIAISRFSSWAASYSGHICGGISKIKDGELILSIWLNAYLKTIHPTANIIDRGYDKVDSKWWIKVSLAAKIKSANLQEAINKLIKNISSSEKKIQELKEENEILKKMYDHALLSNRELLESNQNFEDYIEWNKFEQQFSILSSDIKEEKLELFCNSTSTVVQKKCAQLKAEYYLDKYRYEDALKVLHFLIQKGEATASIHNKLGIVYWKTKRGYNIAENQFKKALALKPDSDLKKTIIYNLASVIGLQHRFKDALDVLNKYDDEFYLDNQGKVLRAALQSKYSQELVCKDLKDACGDNKKGICENWNKALKEGDCLESGSYKLSSNEEN